MDKPDPQAAWLEAWAAAQRDLWQTFASGTAPAAPPPGLTPAHFMQLFGGSLPESSRDVTRRIMDFGESYLGVAREFWRLLEAAPPASETDAAARFDALRTQLLRGFAGVHGGAGAMGLAPGADALAAWSRLTPAFQPGLGLPQGFGMPALGPGRERQEALERLTQAAARYQAALGAFAALLGRVSSDAVDRLARRITERSGNGQRPDSLRAVYDLWVDCGEEAYAAAAHAPDFAKAQADLSDALMDLKREQQRQVEEWARVLDLPTRSEMNTVLKRVNTLRRRLRELEEEIEQLRGTRRP